jgi:hypothetical protein
MRYRVLFSVVLSSLLASGVCFSQPGTMIRIGGQYWYAMPDYRGEPFKRMDIGSGNMFGPYVNVQLGKLTIGSSMFFGPFGCKTTFDVNGSQQNFDLNISRNDLNFRAGLNLFPGFVLFGMVKSLSFKGDKTATINSTEARFAFERKGILYGFGVSGVFPFRGSPFFLSWSAAYLMGTIETKVSSALGAQTVDDYSKKSDVNVTAFTAGLGYGDPFGLNVVVGYKTDLSGENEGEERIHGIVATMTYTIR